MDMKQERFLACMMLAAVGDAIGFKRGHWEFNYNGVLIHEDMIKITNGKGVLALQLEKGKFPYSDDTVMHIATAKGLVVCKPTDELSKICQAVAKEYKACWQYMPGRSPGMTCKRAIQKLYPDGSNWQSIKFQKNGGGCGAAMRAACIGLYLSNDKKKLIELAIETGRTTHHNPLGYLGSMVAAYFTALAIEGVHPSEWLFLLFEEGIPIARNYIRQNREAEANLNGGDWQKFEASWRKYAATRKMQTKVPSQPEFPVNFGVLQRQKYYKSIALTGWPGALGVDSVIIAYDALLGSNQNWQQVCLRGMLHGGDSDSTGTIAGAWFGALYGFKGVPKEHLEKMQGRQTIEKLGQQIYDIVNEVVVQQ